MGVHANITLHTFLKPTIELELVSGGTLDAITKYYVAGVMSFCPQTYNGVGSIPSDIHEITTTDTHRSIKLTQKTYRDVQSFADNGDSRTIVNCTRHCVTDGTYADEVKFSGGTYAGTYTVDEWIDYDNFIIDTTYVDSGSTIFYTDSVRYNRPEVNVSRPTCQAMVYFISKAPPNWKGNFWTRAAYHTTNLENPLTVTAQPTNNYGDYCQIPEICGLGGGMFNALLGYGTPYVYVDGTVTPSEIQTEMEAAGLPYHCGYSTQGYGNNPQFNLMATCRFRGGSSMTVNNSVVVLGGELWSETVGDLTFNNCTINVPISTFTGYFIFNANDCTFFNASLQNTTGGWITGDNNRMYSVPRFGNYGDSTGTYWDIYSEVYKTYGIVNDKDFIELEDASQYMQVAYGSTKLTNCNSLPIYYVVNSPDGSYPDTYMMENVYAKFAGSYQWNWRVYAYGNTAPIRMDVLNINTDDPNNVKRFICNGAANFDAYCYRRMNFWVNSDGEMLGGAVINIVDAADNTYSGTTDVSGYTYIDVLEQHTGWLVADGTRSSWTDIYDTLYTGFTMTLTKTGYQTYTSVFEITEKMDWEFSLPAVVPSKVTTKGNMVLLSNPELGANSQFFEI